MSSDIWLTTYINFLCFYWNRKIQEESLRTYLFTYSSVYDSIRWAQKPVAGGKSSVLLFYWINNQVCVVQHGDPLWDVSVGDSHSSQYHQQNDHQRRADGKFLLCVGVAQSCYWFQCEFRFVWFFWQASLDQPTQTVVMHRTEPTSLQNMALQLAEKLGSLVENNERVFDLKQGVYGGYFNRGVLFSLTRVLTRLRMTFEVKFQLQLIKLSFALDTILRGFLRIPDQKGGYQQKQSYQRGMLKHIKIW